MSTPAAAAAKTPKKPAQIPAGKTELKILMLHGYTQSGQLFSSKTKALAKLLTKALAPSPYNTHPTLIYPTAPHRLRPSDIPGYIPSSSGGEEEDEDESDSWAWFRKDEATGAYRGFSTGMHAIARAVAAAGGVDGVCGFSQGGAVAALVASALEQSPARTPPSPTPTSTPSSTSAVVEEEQDWSWVPALRAANHNKPLQFCIVYSGFYAPQPTLSWLYAPPITTPSLQFVGSLDTVVEEWRSQGLVERCRDPTVVVHPGGHYVPVAKDWAMVLVGWLRQRCEDNGEGRDAGAAEKESL
ncbi:hypothetical protein GGR54DRAFT_617119 [Hypoxylon sp. NC1633]|nr:hypothetical protein GGR54DRAFT_617119 [Hypoxylon sp. NC1633]